MTRQPTNFGASVRARLLDGARKRGEDFNLTLQRYAAERLLYRLGESPFRNRFVLKGAMLFALWGSSFYRATRDPDFTGYGDGDPESIVEHFREICGVPCPTDGMEFIAESVKAEPIRDESEYAGFRIQLECRLDTARISLQIDIGLGNAISPQAVDHAYPVLLDGPDPYIRAYPPEAVVAEKLHTIVMLGSANSRMKDFYDLYVISTRLSFSGRVLAQAISATFQRRRTPIPEGQFAGLSKAFYADNTRAVQYRRYLERNSLPGSPVEFGRVGEALGEFLLPPLRALAGNSVFEFNWNPGGPWAARDVV